MKRLIIGMILLSFTFTTCKADEVTAFFTGDWDKHTIKHMLGVSFVSSNWTNVCLAKGYSSKTAIKRGIVAGFLAGAVWETCDFIYSRSAKTDKYDHIFDPKGISGRDLTINLFGAIMSSTATGGTNWLIHKFERKKLK